MAWTTTYRPRTLGEVVGNGGAVEAVERTFRAYARGELPKALLLHGGVGCGKTSAVYAAASDVGLLVREYSVPALDAEGWAKVRLDGAAAGEEPKVFLFEDADGSRTYADLVDFLKRFPVLVVLTATSTKGVPTQAKRRATAVRFERPSDATVLRLLMRICEGEGVAPVEPVLRRIAHRAPSVRRAVATLQAVTLARSSKWVAFERYVDGEEEEVGLVLTGEAEETSLSTWALLHWGLANGSPSSWLRDVNRLSVLARETPGANAYLPRVLALHPEREPFRLKRPFFRSRKKAEEAPPPFVNSRVRPKEEVEPEPVAEEDPEEFDLW